MKRMRMLALGIGMMGIASMTVFGVAEAKTFQDGLDINFGDAFVAACTAASTHCMEVKGCDFLAANSDLFEWMAIGVAPSGLLGKMEDDLGWNGGCGTQSLCRGPGSVGPIKAVIGIAHVSGIPGAEYYLSVTCKDKNGAMIDDSKTTLKRTTENH